MATMTTEGRPGDGGTVVQARSPSTPTLQTKR